MAGWNPWHGCHKISTGCQNCYVYRMDSRHGRDSSQVKKTGAFALPIQKTRSGSYKIPSGETVYTCFTSDFFVENADPWREEAWQMMRQRQDLRFFMITKRIERYKTVLPPDWGMGYDNVVIGCTVENQEMADYRLPLYRQAPIRHKYIICEPLLEPIRLNSFLSPEIEAVIAGGESGLDARVCDFAWVLDLRRQCVEAGVPFHFKQTGAKLRKNGRLYTIERRYQHSQAQKAKIDFQYKIL